MKNEIKGRIDKIEKGIVPEGYQETKIGILPEDWEVDYLDRFCNITTGNKDTQDKKYSGKYPFFVRSNNIERIDSYSYEGEAILTAGDGVGTGKVFHYINNKFDYHQRVYCLNQFNNINTKFLYYYFSRNFIKQVIKYSAKTSVDSVRREMLTKMNIPIPSLQEQEKIADILSTWDKAIENIEKLIKEKEVQKKGLMQQLLTGETRLPGFTYEWNIKRFKTEFKVSQGLQIPIKDRYQEKVKDSHIYITNEYINNLNNNKYEGEYIKEPNPSVICTNKDILMTRTGNTGIVVSRVEGVFHNNFFKIDYNEKYYNQDFLIYLLESSYIQHKIATLAGTSTIPDLTHSDFYSLECPIPSLQEQKAIAEILSTADKEIELLKQLLENKKQEKKGLMQLLLTGIIRV